MLVKMAKATIKIPTMTNVGRMALRRRPTRRLLKLSSLLTPVQSRNWWPAQKTAAQDLAAEILFWSATDGLDLSIRCDLSGISEMPGLDNPSSRLSAGSQYTDTSSTPLMR
jgi:hypothetical protein